MAIQVQNLPAEWLRTKEGLGVWEGKGKVVAVGVGVSPTNRRWDSDPQTSVGAYAIIALQRAMDDAGVTPDQVDGLVVVPDTTTGRFDWPQPWPDGRDIPAEMAAAFNATDDERDGIAKLSAEWVMKNMPELTNLKFVMHAPGDTAPALVAASEAVSRGLSSVCLVVRGWHNFSGRYYVGQGNARGDTIGTREKWTTGWGVVGVYPEATRFQRYLHKYGKKKDGFANFIVNSKKNGLNFPEGFFAQNRPDDVVTKEDYLTARWLAKPANLYDADMPIMAVSGYVITTPERAKDMKQKPVYIRGHSSSTVRPRSLQHTLEESEEGAARTGRIIAEAAGITVNDLSFENMYDGYGMFHVIHLEGLGGFAGIHQGDALDYFESQDISNDSKYPISPSGGNIGSGRTRFWLHVDCMQQIQGRAGARQIRYPAEVGISGATFPHSAITLVWAGDPS
jgi:acetyl-CoA acetyltransferase